MGQRTAAASAIGADAAPAHTTSRSDISSGTEDQASGTSDDEAEASDVSDGQAQDAAEEAARHAAMLAEVRGSAGDRKRKRIVVASEAYPDSEHNLPTTGSTGTQQIHVAELLTELRSRMDKGILLDPYLRQDPVCSGAGRPAALHL